jgi:hypothetical protein
MIEQILPNNNERCYRNFSPTFREVNPPCITRRRHQQAGIPAGVASTQFPLWREETSMCQFFSMSSFLTDLASNMCPDHNVSYHNVGQRFLKPCSLLQIFVPDF